jgi:uncharacterized protein (TIGR00725 family)
MSDRSEARPDRPATDERIVTVFGSSRPKPGDADYEEARALGKSLAERRLAVCSGGYGGVMEAVARGAKDAGGKTYGVTAEFFKRKANEWIDVEVRKKTWEERLFGLIELGDGFVACKGGTGTLVELAVVWEMMNKSVMEQKPFVTLGDFWEPILQRVQKVAEDPGAATGARVRGVAQERLLHGADGVQQAVEFLADRLKPGKEK